MDQFRETRPCQARLIYAAASVNRHSNCLDCQDEYLVFARSHSLAIYNKRLRRIVRFLRAHSDDVSSVQFIKTADESQDLTTNQEIIHDDGRCQSWILSTSYDKTSIIWKMVSGLSFEPIHTLEGHEGAVLSGHSILDYSQDNINDSSSLLTVTSDIDSVTKLWRNGTLVDTLKTDYMGISLKLAKFFNSHSQDNLTILCLGGSDDNVHIYCISKEYKLIHLIDITGHADWIRSIDIIKPLSSQPIIMLASASQDRFIRVWKISLTESNQSSIRKMATRVQVSVGKNYQRPLFVSVTLETVLAGHEGRVYDIKWSRVLQIEKTDSSDAKIHLLSCSSDKSIIIWESKLASIFLTDSVKSQQEKNLEADLIESNMTDDIWQQVHRVGEAGECNLGFLGVSLSRDSSTIYAYSLNGAIHSWVSSSNTSDGESLLKWNPTQTVGGHFGPVTDIVWQKDGHYFMTSSLDKTCRVHGYVEHRQTWNEISRPQVHGYEINCLTLIDSLRLASGADEKTIRLFEATNFFVRTFQKLTNKNLLHMESASARVELAAHAQVPALGLSNRAVSSDEDFTETSVNIESNLEYKKEASFCPDELNLVPVEEILLQSTLWPEIQKLYGHSYEIYSIASDAKNKYLASASRANKPEFARIIIWDLSSFEKISTLSHHTLTVTRLRYSLDNKYLLSVSRDRTWCLWANDIKSDFEKIASTTKQTTKHDRIIWDCTWTPDSSHFVTVSRDRKAIAWNTDAVVKQRSGNFAISECQTLILDDSIQAVDILNSNDEIKSTEEKVIKNFMVSFGLEKGGIIVSILSIVSLQDENTSNIEWSTCFTIKNCHQMPIKRLAFRPRELEKDNRGVILASIAEDCIVSLYSIE